MVGSFSAYESHTTPFDSVAVVHAYAYNILLVLCWLLYFADRTFAVYVQIFEWFFSWRTSTQIQTRLTLMCYKITAPSISWYMLLCTHTFFHWKWCEANNTPPLRFMYGPDVEIVVTKNSILVIEAVPMHSFSFWYFIISIIDSMGSMAVLAADWTWGKKIHVQPRITNKLLSIVLYSVVVVVVSYCYYFARFPQMTYVSIRISLRSFSIHPCLFFFFFFVLSRFKIYCLISLTNWRMPAAHKFVSCN